MALTVNPGSGAPVMGTEAAPCGARQTQGCKPGQWSYLCTRHAGHAGHHIAHGRVTSNRPAVITTWPPTVHDTEQDTRDA